MIPTSSAPIFTFKTCWMKYIPKRPVNEPRSLTDYRNTPNATYAELHGEIKQELREALGSEQGFICAYCMARIEPTNERMVIEHYIPQIRHSNSPYNEQTHRGNQLNYYNLLGTCQQPRCCSGIRGNMPLTINPMDVSCERLVQFGSDGRAYSADVRAQTDIDNTLKLNDQTLKDNRQSIIDAARKKLELQSPEKPWSDKMLDQEIDNWLSKKRTRHGLAYQEYCMAAVHYLKSKKSK